MKKPATAATVPCTPNMTNITAMPATIHPTTIIHVNPMAATPGLCDVTSCAWPARLYTNRRSTVLERGSTLSSIRGFHAYAGRVLQQKWIDKDRGHFTGSWRRWNPARTGGRKRSDEPACGRHGCTVPTVRPLGQPRL